MEASDIINFYYLTDLWQNRIYYNLDEQRTSHVKLELAAIRDIYLKSYYNIIKEQLIKYYKRGRINANVDFDINSISNATNYKTLLGMMSQTFRSDMKRRNQLWEQLCEHLAELEKRTDTDNTIYHINLINNCVHHTGMPILEKFTNGDELLDALEFCHRATPQQLKGKTVGLQYIDEGICKISKMLTENIRFNNGIII